MSGFKASFHGVARRVMVLMMLADGKVEDGEVTAIQMTYERLTGEPISEKQVDKEVLKARADGRSIEDFLSVLALAMDEHDKAMVVRAAYMIAVADGDFGTEEQVLLGRIGTSLGMSPAQVEASLSRN